IWGWRFARDFRISGGAKWDRHRGENPPPCRDKRVGNSGLAPSWAERFRLARTSQRPSASPDTVSSKDRARNIVFVARWANNTHSAKRRLEAAPWTVAPWTSKRPVSLPGHRQVTPPVTTARFAPSESTDHNAERSILRREVV